MARILVVEDDLATLETYSTYLRVAGHQTTNTVCCRDAGTAIRTRPFDLVLADYSLPDGTALDVIDYVRGARQEAPVVIVTGYGAIPSAVEAMRRGAVDYVEKPLIGDSLLVTVERALLADPKKREPGAPESSHLPVVTRWATCVMRIAFVQTDLRNVGRWARVVGASASSLRDWCHLAGTSAGQSLDFGRVLRAVLLSRDSDWVSTRYLDVSDPRTLRALMMRAGLPRTAPVVSVADFLARQSFVSSREAIAELRTQLLTRGLWFP